MIPLTPLKIVVLAIVQGLAELLPVSSSAHVITAEKLMGLDPSQPETVLLLVMLHTGTMFAVIFYFWRAWKKTFFASREVFRQQAVWLATATTVTLVLAGALKVGIEKWMAVVGHVEEGRVELLFGNLGLVAAALAAAGVLILVAGLVERRHTGEREIRLDDAAWIGFVQGLCLPFRGFSRSGATISVGLLKGVLKQRAEEFSFALAVILTPIADGYAVWQVLRKHHGTSGPAMTWNIFTPGLLGMVCAFIAGLLA